MARLVAAYPYLLASAAILVLILGVARATLGPNGLRATARSGWVGLPAGFLAPFFEGAYWRPTRLGGGPVGVEDALFGFATAAIVWYLVLLRYPELGAFRAGSASSILATLVSGGATCAVFVAALRAGADPMTSALVACAAMTAAFLAARRARPAVALWGAASFAATYTVFVGIVVAVLPGFGEQWSAAGPWGARVVGVPLGEVAWAAAFGGFWPCLLLHVQRPASVAGSAPGRLRPPSGPPERIP